MTLQSGAWNGGVRRSETIQDDPYYRDTARGRSTVAMALERQWCVVAVIQTMPALVLLLDSRTPEVRGFCV